MVSENNRRQWINDSLGAILLLPLDVANRRRDAAIRSCKTTTLPMDDLYSIYIITLVYVAILIPFTTFWYESDFDATISQSCTTVHFGSSCLPYSLVLYLCWYYTIRGFFNHLGNEWDDVAHKPEEGMGMNKCIVQIQIRRALRTFRTRRHQHLLPLQRRKFRSYHEIVDVRRFVSCLCSCVDVFRRLVFIRSVRGNRHGCKPNRFRDSIYPKTEENHRQI